MQQLHAAMKNGRHPFFVSRISEGCPPLRAKRSNKIAQKKKQCAGQMNKPLSNFLSIAIIHVSEKGELILSRSFKRPASRSVLRIGQENPHAVRRIYLEGDPSIHVQCWKLAVLLITRPQNTKPHFSNLAGIYHSSLRKVDVESA